MKLIMKKGPEKNKFSAKFELSALANDQNESSSFLLHSLILTKNRTWTSFTRWNEAKKNKLANSPKKSIHSDEEEIEGYWV